MRTLTDEDVQVIEGIVNRAVANQGVKKDADPWLTRAQAAGYLNFSLSSFERARRQHPDSLKPCSDHPVRWSQNALTVFKMTRGLPLRNRPGRKPKLAA